MSKEQASRVVRSDWLASTVEKPETVNGSGVVVNFDDTVSGADFDTVFAEVIAHILPAPLATDLGRTRAARRHTDLHSDTSSRCAWIAGVALGTRILDHHDHRDGTRRDLSLIPVLDPMI